MMERKRIEEAARSYTAWEGHPEFRGEVEELLRTEQWEALNDRFYTEIEFGTGGLRGEIGGGFNRINPYMIRRATQGLAEYVADQKRSAAETRSLRVSQMEEPEEGSLQAVIAYDSRRYSADFALEAARVLATNGFVVSLFDALRPTPELSFAVRRLGADVGIVVTASHNPPAYNGYKVYWNDGSQVVAPHDHGIIERVGGVRDEISAMSREDAERSGRLRWIGAEMDEEFLAMVGRQSVRPSLFQEHGSELRMVYTPLHGAGASPIERAVGERGVRITTVPEQREPDGNFPTVELPNPEEGEALEMAIELARKEHADLVVGTDPDVDRLGIAVPDGTDYRLITGNQHGALLVDYIFGARKEDGTLPERPAFIKTIVTTELQRRIAEAHGAEVYDTLTGFKHIAAKIREFEADPSGPAYVMGDEESYGYMIGTEVRDKDAVTATLLTAEMALHHVSRGSSLLERLNELYGAFGYFEERTVSRYFPGQAGAETMKQLMTKLRTDPPAEFGGQRVLRVRDYLEGITHYVPEERREKDIDLPSSNVLQFDLADGSKVSARPSGTEPKIKFYASVQSEPTDDLDSAKADVARRISDIEENINGLIPEG